MRQNIPLVEIKRLLLESGGICAFPGCDKFLVSPETPSDEGAVIAEMAHIVADSREGPRGRAPLTDDERRKADNLVALCGDHHTIVDTQLQTYSVQVMRQMKTDHLARIRRKLTPLAPQPATVLREETIRSSLLRVSLLPSVVFEAKCAFERGQESDVRERIDWHAAKGVLLPFDLSAGKLFAFQDLRRRGNPFSGVIDFNSVREHEAAKMWTDDDDRRLYMRLLNRTLFKYTGHRDVRYDVYHRRFYFIPLEEGKERSVSYKSLTGRNTERLVVWEPKRRATGIGVGVWWHVAAALNFQQFSPLQWCFTIRPEWNLTKDGSTPLEPVRVGRRVTSKKSRMYNINYLTEVNFWRDFLADGSPRIIMDFGDQSAIIETELLSFPISWPGVPNDERRFEQETREENLFTLTELNEAVSGDFDWDDENWEDGDE